jgi:hypothetical protein
MYISSPTRDKQFLPVAVRIAKYIPVCIITNIMMITLNSPQEMCA